MSGRVEWLRLGWGFGFGLKIVPVVVRVITLGPDDVECADEVDLP